MVSEVLDDPEVLNSLNNWFKDFFKDFIVSNNLDLKDLTFAELFQGFPQYMKIAGFYKHLETNSKDF